MKRRILPLTIVALSSLFCLSCSDFLKERPVTFVSPENFYLTGEQIEQATLGCYVQIRPGLFENYGAPGCEPYFLYERLTGNVETAHGLGANVGLPIATNNADTDIMWHYYYSAIENCNGTIAGIENTTAIIDETLKSRDLAEVYFLRAYYYFNLVRFFGPVPYKTTPTTGVEGAALPCDSEETIYNGIVSDLKKAESLFPATDPVAVTNGRAGIGATKSLLSKVYLTMAGYPLQKEECYQLAYEKALEVVSSGAYQLFGSHEEWRNSTKTSTRGENIFSVQCDANNATSYLHRSLLPYPVTVPAIGSGQEYGGHMLPTQHFYDAFEDGDERKTAYFYTSYPSLDDPGVTVSFSRPYIYKFFDEGALSNGKSGLRFPIIRYADVLLTLAEAACAGGSTTDPAALKAFTDVRSRAVKGFSASSITADQVLCERFYELCFEGQNWYDMIRTRKAFNPASRQMVDMMGYKAETCPSPYDESYLYAPYPDRDYALNPNLKR